MSVVYLDMSGAILGKSIELDNNKRQRLHIPTWKNSWLCEYWTRQAGQSFICLRIKFYNMIIQNIEKKIGIIWGIAGKV